MAYQIAHELRSAGGRRCHVRTVRCADILASASIVGEAERMLAEVFREAERG
eukprot:CAMPEP_0181117322 /NCGR_PEP_ID=MMETSP1071-20121207/22447_1 /TAXON_ID=35127 /ORGANISM="Thalassiosira sp., Strain NH16" /LENGTH=51 /DNA_ID=CAMNT_0023201675 /DNA_START=8 /DNA_END=160 /DNA_ORIENTATION=-